MAIVLSDDRPDTEVFPHMKTAIIGAGLVGSYLYRLLHQTVADDITIFEKPETLTTRCGISPCAWGTSVGFEELIEDAGLDPATYIIRKCDKIVLNEIRVKASVTLIDKPRLNADLLNGASVLRSPVNTDDFDNIIDTTGFSRAFLPPIANDSVASCVQYRVSSREVKELRIDISNLGYAWCFPLSGDEYHIGAGSIAKPPQRMLENLGWLNNSSRICSCIGKIRLTGPHGSLPLVDVKNGHPPVWGAGEAIGVVAPLTGEGILPGLKNAGILLANRENPEAYQRKLLAEFAWMKAERKIVDKAVRGKRLNVLDARVLINSAKRLEIKLNLNQSLSLLNSLYRT